MATSVVGNGVIVVQLPPEILGPGSEYEERRLALRKDWGGIVEAAKALKVVDPESCEEATKLGRLLQASDKEVESFYKPIKEQIDALKKPILAAEKEDRSAITAQKTQLGTQITGFNEKQRQAREAVERAAREESERQAREDALARAVELESQGELQAAEQLLNEPVAALPVMIQSAAPPRVAGQVAKETFSCEVTDVWALLQAVLDKKVPLAAIEVNQSFLNGKARLEKESFIVPGCKLKRQAQTHFRS